MTRQRFDLWHDERKQATVIDHGLRVLAQDTPPVLKIWNPKAEKPTVHFRFRSIEQREAYLLKYVESYDEQMVRKAAVRQQRTEATAQHSGDIQVGHVFSYSWGYDQTNVQYFQVTEKHGQNVTVHEIAQSPVPNSEGFMSNRVEPRRGHFLGNSKPFTKRVQFTSDGQAYLAFDYGWCELWRGGSTYRSWYA